MEFEFDNLNMYIVMTEKLLHRRSSVTIGIKMLMSGIGSDMFERYPRTRDMT